MERPGQPQPRFTRWFFIFLVLGFLVAYLNRHHVEQQSNYRIYVAMADYYRGVASSQLLTYPTWGYPFVLLVIRRYDLVAIPQVLLGAVAMTALFLRVRRELPEEGKAVTVLFLLAIPWYLLHSVKWPLSFAASVSVLGVLVLERALRLRSVGLGVSAGLLLGASLYFRSEFLYLPLFLVCIGLLSHFTKRLPPVPLAPLAVCAVSAWVILIPWGLHYRQQTGHFSLTASQRGIVAFISLGQLPGNPWGAVYEDEYAYAYLEEVAPHLRVNSDAADRLLVEEFTRRVKAEPLAFAAKMVWNAGISLVSGFYAGEIPLSPTQWDQFRRIKRRPWQAVLPVASSSRAGAVDARTGMTLLYWLVSKSVAAVFVILAVAGLVGAVWHGIRSPLLLLCASTIVYQWLLFVALTTEPRYKNGLYLYMVPFVIMAWRSLSGRGLRRVFRREAAAL